jgi:hypothetical protein
LFEQRNDKISLKYEKKINAHYLSSFVFCKDLPTNAATDPNSGFDQYTELSMGNSDSSAIHFGRLLQEMVD